jgi:DNA invertase Pin-like site-specific DNA recombinase
MLATITPHEIDVVVVWSVSHLGISVDTLLDTVAEPHRHRVRYVIHECQWSCRGDRRAAGCG